MLWPCSIHLHLFWRQLQDLRTQRLARDPNPLVERDRSSQMALQTLLTPCLETMPNLLKGPDCGSPRIRTEAKIFLFPPLHSSCRKGQGQKESAHQVLQ